MSPAALIGRSRARTRLFHSGSKLFITVYNCRSDPIHFEVFFRCAADWLRWSALSLQGSYNGGSFLIKNRENIPREGFRWIVEDNCKCDVSRCVTNRHCGNCPEKSSLNARNILKQSIDRWRNKLHAAFISDFLAYFTSDFLRVYWTLRKVRKSQCYIAIGETALKNRVLLLEIF